MQVSKAIEKQLTSDSTRLINNLLDENYDCAQLSDNEKLSAGLFQIAYSPVKISYGVMLMTYGLLITPIPGLITKIRINGTIYEEGTTSEFAGIDFGLRVPKTPFHYKKKTVCHSQTEPTATVTDVEGFSINCGYSIFSPKMPINSTPVQSNEKSRFEAASTVSGLRFFCAGLDRVIVGACDPVLGLKKAIPNPFK